MYFTSPFPFYPNQRCALFDESAVINVRCGTCAVIYDKGFTPLSTFQRILLKRCIFRKLGCGYKNM